MMTPKMKEDLCTQILNASRQLFLSSKISEVYHNYTLLHDDLMDRADKRRGKETVHKVWNEIRD